mmetsp:Transcript_15258/g.28723  ORF Transcript_15258/g.28723 Transcript_15258/m.28723 type:complete len:529 (+) Transcript_15258:39-1625(+)
MASSAMLKVAIPLLVMTCIWLALLVSVLTQSPELPGTGVSISSVRTGFTGNSGSVRSPGVRGFFSGMSGLMPSGEGGSPPKLSALPYVDPSASRRVVFQEPPPLDEIRRNITTYLGALHSRLGELVGPRATGLRIWETFLDVTSKTLLLWDEQNSHRFPTPRHDNSIFVSVGTYRDEYCPMTLKSLYSQAEFPEKVFVGLFQQNCFETTCTTGVLKNGAIEDTGTDVNCYDVFCDSAEGRSSGACADNRVRLFNVNESESLGPYMARYFGAKFYRGEQFYLQIDSHSEFAKLWDTKLIEMIGQAPADRPVISTYPPGPDGRWQDSVGNKICDSSFASSQIEWQIVRLDPSRPIAGHPREPVYAPFVAAGFFFAHGQFLHDVPFDPLLPWIFMGEEISMSARLWTSGYDIFSPTRNVLNHYYVRRHKPKFWETVNRYFDKGVHNDIVELVIKRVKHMLGYPECAARLVQPPSVLHKLDRWSMGRERSFSDYMHMVGLDPVNKVSTRNEWCHQEVWPEDAMKFKTRGSHW